jgi:hypothetical protein
VPWGQLQKETYPGGFINQFAWKDNALALFFSTYYTGDKEKIVRLHRRPRTKSAAASWDDKQLMLAPWPAFANEYNLKKGGVDRGDQLRSYNVWSHAIRRGRQYVLFLEFLLDTVLINTYLVGRQRAREHHPWKKGLCQRQWRSRLFGDVVAKYGPDAGGRLRSFNGTSKPGAARTALADHHLIRRGKNSPCLACKGKQMLGSTGPKKRVALGEISGNTKRFVHDSQPARRGSRWGLAMAYNMSHGSTSP